MKNRLIAVLALTFFCAFNSQLTTARAQSTAFTYQGQLNDSNGPVSGIHAMSFALFNTNATGVPVAGPVTNSAVLVSNGLFITTIDLGAGVFTGSNVWLGLTVDGGPELTPRQPITPVPYAIYAMTPAGPQGLQGIPGTNGLNGLNGTNGLNGLNGTNGATGPQGLQGIAGANGTNGVNGLNGLNGTNGLDGATGATGPQGPVGTFDSSALTNYPTLNGTNVFTGTNQFAGVMNATNVNNVLVGTHSGNGSALTNLNPANISSGNASINISGNAATATTATTATSATSATTATTANNFSGPLAGDVTGTQGATVVSANFPRLNGTNVFTGSNTFSGVVRATGLNNTFSGTFAGNGASVSNVDLATVNTRGAITVTPLVSLSNPLGFLLSSSPGAGVNPVSPIVADVNGDGKMDLICGASGANRFSVLTNNGSGGFGLTQSPIFGGVEWAVAADVNGDGKVDLISASGGSQLYVLTNNGSGTFALSSTTVVGNTPRGVVAADINSDGKVDVISANETDNTLTVLTNNGSGGFVSASTNGVGSGPVSVTAADINGDGKVDLISANRFASTLSVVTNNGSGGFGSNATYTVGSTPYSVVAADVNGDGKVDLISANAVANTLSVLTNNGSGGFTLAASPPVGTGPRSVVAADLNGDSKVDLISANGNANTLSVLTNNGSGGFVTFGTLSVGTTPYSVTAADVNGDGWVDFVSANYNANTLSVLTNTAAGTPYYLVAFTGSGAGLTNIGSASLVDGSISNVDISTTAAIAYSKLNLANSIVNADISSSAAIAYSKLNLANSIVNADISSSAAIADSKLAQITSANKVADSALTANVALLNRSVQAFTGGTNSFSGNVGIGTTTPAVKLHVTGGSDAGPSGGGFIVAGDNNGFNVAIDDNEIMARNNGAVSTLYLQANGGNTCLNQTAGKVGIGTDTPTKGSLEIADISRGSYTFGASGTHGTFLASGVTGNIANNTSGTDTAMGLYCANDAAAFAWYAFSDERIKKIKGRSDAALDLDTLLRLEVTDYTYIDTVKKGDGSHKKLIAQQAEKVFPEAVSQSTDEVPDIYQLADIRDGWAQLTTDLKPGERVKLIAGKTQGVYEVLEVAEGRFRTAFKPEGDKVFVYGREVNDFRKVDYEAVSMLNVSATQELARQLEKQKAENAELKARLEKLEQLLLNTASGEAK